MKSITFAQNLGSLFYIVSPNETSYKNVDDVPPIVENATSLFIGFILLESLVLWLQGKALPRINDSITSISLGLFQQCVRIFTRGAESMAYIYIYEHFRIKELPWDSAWTWWLTALGVDFAYYWVHRAGHEVNAFWAAHQVHHSSEEYNLTTALRQSVFQGWFAWIFYLPLAFFVPPSQFLTHQQFNLLFQFWIHTKTIKSLGPLEYVFNTPSHHCVHHGANNYCLDKNYAGVLIIWDRMFGTFEPLRKDEPIVYGLVTNEESFNPLWLQLFYYRNMWQKVKNMDNWKERLSVFWKGPGWMPGKPRLGAEEDLPDLKYRDKFDVQQPTSYNLYLILHFFVIVYGYQELALRNMTMNQLSVIISAGYILLSLTSIGLIFNDNPYAYLLEFLRCSAFLVYIQKMGLLGTSLLLVMIQAYIFVSAVIWGIQAVRNIHFKVKSE